MRPEPAPNPDLIQQFLETDTCKNEIFISYSRRDKSFVEVLDAALRINGKEPWIDWEDIQPTEDWWQAIELGIEGASTFIFVISPDSVISTVCRQEVEYAVQHNKRLVPLVRREGFEMQQVHPAVSRHNWLFFRESDCFEQAFQKLVAAIDTDLIYVRVHTRLLVRAKEWAANQRDDSFLLRGSDLENAEQWLAQSVTQSPQPIDLQREYIEASRRAEAERQAIELRLRQITPQQYRNRQALLSKVRNYWLKGVLENSLQNRVLMELGLEERSDAINHPWQVTIEPSEQPSRPLPAGTCVMDLFDQLGEGRTLLILGEPGAGKTTTLLELAKDLITRAEQSIDHRIPVVFNLSSWTEGKPAIEKWLVEELNTKYQVPKTIGQTWVQNQQLLLLLDGLDEVRSTHRNACVAALNYFQQQYGAEMVVCSRIKDYENLANRLNFQTAIYVRSLTLAQIHHYLNHTRSDLATLKALINEDSALQELAKSPLMLNIMTLAYEGVDIAELPTMNLDDRRRQLFNCFIDRMFQRRGIYEPYSQQQMMNWLIWLAQRMVQHSQSVFLIEGIQPDWLQTRFQKRTYQILVEMIVGLIWGLSFGLLSRILNYNVPPWVGLQLGVITGLLTGCLAGLLRSFYAGSYFGLISGLIAGLVFWVASLQLRNPQPLNLLIFGIIAGVIAQRLNYPTIEPADTIKWSWTKGRRFFLIGTIWGLIVGAILLISRLFLPPEFYTQFCRSDSQLWERWTGSVFLNFFCQTNRAISLLMLLGLVALGLFVGFAVSLLLGFNKVSEIERRTIANQGIWRSAMNTIKLIAITGPLAGLMTGFVWLIYFYSAQSASGATSANAALDSELIWWIHYGNQPGDVWLFSFSVALLVGLLGGLVSGVNSGIVCLRHLMLRLILWQHKYIPWNLARFLNYATERILLQKVGSGYIFIHRLLLEHFAQL